MCLPHTKLQLQSPPSDYPLNGEFVVTVTDGQLATIEGYRGDYSDTNKLFGLTGEGSGRKWTEKFPPIPCQLNVPTCLHCVHVHVW